MYDSWRARHRRDRPDAGSRRERSASVDADDWARRFVALADGLALHVLLHPGSVTVDDMERIAREHIAATLRV